MNFNLPNGEKFILIGKGSYNQGDPCRIEIEQGCDYISYTDENDYTKRRPIINKKIPVTDDLYVTVTTPTLFDPAFVCIHQDSKSEDGYDLWYGLRNKKNVQKLISILEMNGIKVVINKPTKKA